MRYIKLITYLGLLFTSCIKEIAIDLEQNENKLNELAVTSFVSLENNDSIYLDYTYEINKQELVNPNNINATIEISKNNYSLGFLDNWGNGRYTIPSNILLETKQSYHLNIVKNGYETITGTFEIPDKEFPIEAFTEYFPSPSGNDTREFQFYFQDNQSVKNYYEVILLAAY